MYQGYVSTSEQDRARWELMQKHAQERAERTASRSEDATTSAAGNVVK